MTAPELGTPGGLHGRTAKSLWYSQLLNNLDVVQERNRGALAGRILTGNGRSQI